MSEVYDLYVTKVPSQSIDALVYRPGFAGIHADLASCRAMLGRVRKAGGNGLVIPARYASASMSEHHAYCLAQAAYVAIRERSVDSFGELERGEDEGLWWVFCADNITKQAEGAIPGMLRIAIDKLDGHVVEQSEQRKYLALSVL